MYLGHMYVALIIFLLFLIIDLTKTRRYKTGKTYQKVEIGYLGTDLNSLEYMFYQM